MDAQWVGTSAPYLGPHTGDAWATEAAAQGARGTQRIAFAGPVVPPQTVNRALNAPEGAEVVARRRVMYLNDQPVELTDSYYPSSIAAGTALAEPRKIPGGAPRLLADLGHATAQVDEDVYSRPATAEEREALQLPNGEWVLILERTTRNAAGQPVEASVMTMAARQSRLHYTMKVG